MSKNRKELRCSASTDANKLAGSIYSTYKEHPKDDIVIRAIGAGSLNQAVKAVIICNKYFAKTGVVLGITPSFKDTEEHVTAIEMKILFINV